MTDQYIDNNSSRRSNRHHLRDAVGTNHAMAEQAWMADGKFSSPEKYEDFLRALLIAHLSLGLPAALHRRCVSELGLERERIFALRKDLGLKVDVIPEGLILSNSYAWGVAYVLNGSCLGAAVLLKSGAIEPAWPSAYLRTSQSCVSSGRLGAFFRALNAFPLHRPDAVAGARDVFTVLSEAPSPLLHGANERERTDACSPG